MTPEELDALDDLLYKLQDNARELRDDLHEVRMEAYRRGYKDGRSVGHQEGLQEGYEEGKLFPETPLTYRHKDMEGKDIE